MTSKYPTMEALEKLLEEMKKNPPKRIPCEDNPLHRLPRGPNEDIGQCSECGMPIASRRPSSEQFGYHKDDCSLPIDHLDYCVGGGSGHSAEGKVVRG